MDIDMANQKLARCAQMLTEEFEGEMHFVLFVLQSGDDGESIEVAHVASMPVEQVRSVIMGVLAEDEKQGLSDDDGIPVNRGTLN